MLSIAALCGLMVISAESAVVNLPVSDDSWEQGVRGDWRFRYDHRDLFAMRHPWKPSAEGSYASVQRSVTLPKDWQGPVVLSFYCSDDYQAVGKPSDRRLSAEGFVGHRFKQVLIDGKVVWSTDVADGAKPGESPRFRVPLSVEPGKTFRLTLLAYDAVPSTTLLPRDYYQAPGNALKRESDPAAANFATSVYFGDISISGEGDTPAPGKRPSEARVKALHAERWPIPPPGDAWKADSTVFEVSAPAGIPVDGFPAECGLPVPIGRVKNTDGIRFLTQKSAFLAVQKTATGWWPDESTEWLSLAFPIKPAEGPLKMSFGPDEARFYRAAMATESENSVHVDAGSIFFDAGSGIFVGGLRTQPSGPGINLQVALRSGDDDARGTIESWQIIDNGPFRCTVELRGRFDTVDKTLASFRLYCSAYAGMPYLKLTFRLFNETTAALPVTSLPLQLTFPQAPQGVRTPAGEAADGVSIIQQSEKDRTINGAAANPWAPMFVAWKGGAVTIRHFRELFPKRISFQGADLTLDLAPATGSPIVFTPGEAKTHEIWIALGNVDPVQFAATVEQPPILQNAAYFCATGALGPARPHDGVPVLDEAMRTRYGNKRWEDFNQQFGLRDFPDSSYQSSAGEWSNNYYERMLGLWSEWFMSGDRRWYDLARDVSEHIMDVSVVHSAVPGNDWIGAMHGPGKNHVAGPWSPMLRPDGLVLYQKLTGAPGARDAFLGVADYCIRVRAGRDGPSARHHAGPFDAICSAYDETGDVKYLDEGKARVESVNAMMDRRRGVWPEAYGSDVYRGAAPWVDAQLARPIYRWYRLTGDVEAAQALVGLAESVICENTDWDHPGEMSDYSSDPHFAATAAYDPMILPMIFAAYELTGDTFFLDAAKAQWRRWLRDKTLESPLNCYWNTPWLVWYLKEYGLVDKGKIPEALAKPASAPATPK
ncbi:MAG: hypothetical protein HZB26_00005 [Candidatus Hydrogenedentes bacterium]|nr:hypothetical protein [Candidatus Hydrogenedentota bacterium]